MIAWNGCGPWGGGRDFSQSPRCSSICLITSGWDLVMKLMIFISAWHLGHSRGYLPDLLDALTPCPGRYPAGFICRHIQRLYLFWHRCGIWNVTLQRCDEHLFIIVRTYQFVQLIRNRLKMHRVNLKLA